MKMDCKQNWTAAIKMHLMHLNCCVCIGLLKEALFSLESSVKNFLNGGWYDLLKQTFNMCNLPFSSLNNALQQKYCTIFCTKEFLKNYRGKIDGNIFLKCLKSEVKREINVNKFNFGYLL